MWSLDDLRTALKLLFGGLDKDMLWRIAAANALALIGGTLAGLAPVALKHIIDAANQGVSGRLLQASLLGYGFAYLICLSASRLISEVRPPLIGSVEQRLYTGLRLRYCKHLLDLPLSFHLTRRSGSLVQTLQQAVSGYQMVLFSVLNGLLPVLVEGTMVALVLLSLGLPALTGTFALTAVLLTAAISRRMGRLSDAARAVSRANIDTNGHLADCLINYEPIKCFGAERSAVNRFAALSGALEACWQRLQRTRTAIGLSVAMIFALSLTASLAISIHAMHQGTLTIGGFVLANLYMVQIIRPLEMLSSSARDVSQGLAFVRPLIEILQTATGSAQHEEAPAHHRSRRRDAALDTDTASQAGAVSFKDVWLAFDDRTPVLKGLNLEVAAARSIAIVGASGSGKSTLVRLLVRLCEPDAGNIALNGVPIDALPVAKLRSAIAVVPQDLALFNDTIAANIGLGREGATALEIERAGHLAGLHRLVSALPRGYATPIGERGLMLSGGERQRIAIARAILKDPLVYVFDEATSMLDGPTEDAILQNVRAISTGRTTIMIAHRLSAIRHVDEIAVLAEGRIVERGDHAELLLKGGHYAAMWHAQNPA